MSVANLLSDEVQVIRRIHTWHALDESRKYRADYDHNEMLLVDF